MFFDKRVCEDVVGEAAGAASRTTRKAASSVAILRPGAAAEAAPAARI